MSQNAIGDTRRISCRIANTIHTDTAGRWRVYLCVGITKPSDGYVFQAITVVLRKHPIEIVSRGTAVGITDIKIHASAMVCRAWDEIVRSATVADGKWWQGTITGILYWYIAILVHLQLCVGKANASEEAKADE